MNSQDLFKQTFHTPPAVVTSAPGRLEILGNHTDYNEGFVLSAAVDANTEVSFALADNKTFRITSSMANFEIREFNLEKVDTPLPDKDWLNYVRGIVHEFLKAGFQIKPFNAAITSNIPLSAGMSSSAALEMALVTGICELFEIKLSTKEKALIGQRCENNYIGANTGLMDQFTSLSGVKDHLVLSEYRDLNISVIPFPAGYSMVVINSGVKHDLSEDYNIRRRHCEEAAELIEGVDSLRDFDLDLLKRSKSKLSDEVYRRARHIVEENERVHLAVQALKQKDIEQFGQLLFESHKSSIQNFQNSCSELDQLTDYAEKSPLCLGARLSGGGFGGISIHLTKTVDAQKYREEICDWFEKKSGRKVDSYICLCSNGAQAIKPL